MRGQDQGQQVAVAIHLDSGRYGGLDRFDGYIAAGFGVGSGNDVAGPELLREDGRGALGFALEYALGPQKSERQNRDVRVGNRVRPNDCEGNDGDKHPDHELDEVGKDHGRPSVVGREISKFADR